MFGFCKNNLIDELSVDEINNLTHFGLVGLKCKGKIVKIIDGDTFEVLLLINFKDLKKKITLGPKIGEKKKVFTNKKFNFKFVCKINIRLYGIDTIEKVSKENETKFAKQKQLYNESVLLTEQYYNKLNNKIYVEIIGFDKYGSRYIAKVYKDDSYSPDAFCNDFLMNRPELCQPYFGGKKKEFKVNDD